MPIIPTLAQLQQEFGLRNVSIINAKTPAGLPPNRYSAGIASMQYNNDSGSNPFKGKIVPGIAHTNAIQKDADYNLLGKSLGNPVYANLTILAGSYLDSNGHQVDYPRIDLESVLLTVSFPRKIVKTEIQGRNGTVKEYIGEDDAHVTIQGIICSDNGTYPYYEVYQLLNVIQAPVTVEVVSTYLQNLDIHYLVFETREIKQDEGGYSYQKFTLNAISDTAQEVLITG